MSRVKVLYVVNVSEFTWYDNTFHFIKQSYIAPTLTYLFIYHNLQNLEYPGFLNVFLLVSADSMQNIFFLISFVVKFVPNRVSLYFWHWVWMLCIINASFGSSWTGWTNEKVFCLTRLCWNDTFNKSYCFVVLYSLFKSSNRLRETHYTQVAKLVLACSVGLLDNNTKKQTAVH